MVISKIAQIGVAIAQRYGSALMKAEYQVYKNVGYNKSQARTLVMATNVGAGAKYFSSQEDSLSNGISTKNEHVNKTSKSYKTRSRRKQYKQRGCKCRKYANKRY